MGEVYLNPEVFIIPLTLIACVICIVLTVILTKKESPYPGLIPPIILTFIGIIMSIIASLGFIPYILLCLFPAAIAWLLYGIGRHQREVELSKTRIMDLK